MRRLLLGAAMGVLATGLVTGPVAADPGTGLGVSGVRVDSGQLIFTVTGPAGTALNGLTVDVDGTPRHAAV